MIEMLKLCFLFLGVLGTISNGMRCITRNDIPALHVIFHAVGVTGFIWLQWIK